MMTAWVSEGDLPMRFLLNGDKTKSQSCQIERFNLEAAAK